MKEFLSQRGVRYTERDVTQDDAALAELEKLNAFSTPVTVIGDAVVIGFDKAKLERLIPQRASPSE